MVLEEPNWTYSKSQFEVAFGPELLVFCSKSVEVPTLGIDVLGCKLAEEVNEVVQENPSLENISFIGHSLGGLVTRYAIAQLLDQESNHPEASTTTNTSTVTVDVTLKENPADAEESSTSVNTKEAEESSTSFNTKEAACSDESNEVHTSSRTIAGLIPVNFITMATPHLGSRGKGALPFMSLVRFLESAKPTVGPWFLGRTAKHLLLTDAPEPLLLLMSTDCSEGQFMAALSAFKKFVVYANVSGDMMVGWQTSSIRTSQMMPEAIRLIEDPKYKHIHLAPAEPSVVANRAAATPRGFSMNAMGVNSQKSDDDSGEMTFKRCQSELHRTSSTQTEEFEDVMASQLNRVLMTRVDVNFNSLRLGFLAHNLIQVKDYWMHKAGVSIIQHVIDHFQT